MKKIIPFIVLIAFVLSGCRNSSDINERVIVQGIGIDKGKSQRYLVTVQALNKDTYSGIGGTKVPENLVENYYLEGDTVAQALSLLPSRAGKNPLYTHTRIIVIGESLAKSGIENLLDYFARDNSCSARIHLAVCSGKASDILSETEDKESIPSVEIENAVKSAELSLNTVSVHIYEFLKMMREKTTDAYLPEVKTVSKDEKTKGVNCSGFTVFKNGKAVYSFDSYSTVSLNMISDNVDEGTFTLDPFLSGNASFRIYKYTIKKDFRIDESGRPAVILRVKCIFDNVEYNSSDKMVLSEKIIDEMRSALEKRIENQISDFLYYSCKQRDIDCARIGRIVLMKNPDFYKVFSERNEQRFSDFIFDVKADVTVRRIGQLY